MSEVAPAATVEIADALFCQSHFKEVVRRYLCLSHTAFVLAADNE